MNNQEEMNRSFDADEENQMLSDFEQGIPNDHSSEILKYWKSCETCLGNTWTYVKYIIIANLILLTIYLYGLYISSLIQFRDQDPNDHLLKDNFNQSDHRQLTVAGVIAHKRHRHSCNDYQFGCCEIYTDCSYNETDFTDWKVNTFYNTIKKNKEGTNCPHLMDLVTQHNRHYPIPGNKSCETYEEGCQKIETECDIRIRFLDNEDGSKDDIQLYKRHIQSGHSYTNLVERVGIDYTPSIHGLMIEYELKYPSRDFDASGFLILLLSLLLCVSCKK